MKNPPMNGLKVGAKVQSTWGAWPREGIVLARSGDKWKVHFPTQNLTRLCGTSELVLLD